MFLRSALTIGSVSSLLACGPSVAIDDDGESGDGSTTTGTASAESLTGATTATTATTNTTLTATATATAEGDEAASVESSSAGDEVADGGFAPAPDGSCFASCLECDIWGQDCSDGDKCMGWANDGGDIWNATRCTPIDPNPAAIGDPCVVEGSGVSGIDNCEFGAMCWGVDSRTNEGVCVPMCTGSIKDPVCPDGLVCMIFNEEAIITCLPPCDPLAPGCAPDEVCSLTTGFPTNEPFVCLPIPPFEPQQYGEACDRLTVCDDGLACVEAMHVPGCADRACCTVLGDVAAPPVCPDVAQTCLFDPVATEDPCFCGVP